MLHIITGPFNINKILKPARHTFIGHITKTASHNTTDE